MKDDADFEIRVAGLMKRWKVSLPTTRRHIKRLAAFGLKPFRLAGVRPVYHINDVEAAELAYKEAADETEKSVLPKNKVINLREARAISKTKKRAA